VPYCFLCFAAKLRTNVSESVDRRRLALLIGALGVVYGDIGTSPLYALRECFSGTHGIPPRPENVLGVVSLVIWTLILLVSIKYLSLVLNADNRGEGGILALLSLALPDQVATPRRPRGLLLLMGLFGAALLYGDGMLTPAITVLGAVEGLQFVTPVFAPYVVPIAVVIIVTLFSLQRAGTGKVGRVFGPIMLTWFVAIGVLGISGILRSPQILTALSPHHAAVFIWQTGWQSFVVLGSVFLAVTGAEALYADMGHFGAQPIRRAWVWVVFPALVLNYLGAGGLLLLNPEAARNPFFLLAPSWAVLPLVCLATLAAVIASQALISGAYSLTMQAIQMGYLPRLFIQHTSHSERGQIYVPQVNTLLMLACLGLVLGFQSSSRLAAAYGIAVSLTMLITTVLFFSVSRRLCGWSLLQACVVCAVFGLIELAFAAANGLKIPRGGWFPLVVALLLFVLMTTWKKGRSRLRNRLAGNSLPLELFLQELHNPNLCRVPGTAVFLSGNATDTPIALLHSLRHYKTLHLRVIIMTIVTREVPFVNDDQRLQIESIRPNFYRLTGCFGFMEQPNVPLLLELAATRGIEYLPMETTFFLSRETILARNSPGMQPWRKRLFAAMSRNAQSAAAFFNLPPNRVVELGMQVEL
jgi:KUP system potassium uptake protein